VDEAKASEMAWTETVKTQVRDKNAAAVTDEDMGDLAPAVDEKSQLAACLPGKLGHAPRCFRRHDLLCAGFAPAETLDLLDLTGLQAGGFTFYFGYGFLRNAGSRTQCKAGGLKSQVL
jgi:hypothetical protein